MLGNELLLYTVNELPLGAGVQVVQQPLILLLQMITIRLLFKIYNLLVFQILILHASVVDP